MTTTNMGTEQLVRRFGPHTYSRYEVPEFPNYSDETFNYPQRFCNRSPGNSTDILLLGPPIGMYYSDMPISNTVFVSSLPRSTSMKDVVEKFEKHGSICSYELVLERKTYDPKLKIYSCAGYAWITFVQEEAAKRAIQQEHLSTVLDGIEMKQISVYKGSIRCCLFITGIKKVDKERMVDKICMGGMEKGFQKAVYYPHWDFEPTKCSIKVVFSATEYILKLLDLLSHANPKGSFQGIKFENWVIPDLDDREGEDTWEDEVLKDFQPLAKTLLKLENF